MNAAAIRSDWAGRTIDGNFTLLQWLGGVGQSGVFLTELADPTQKAAIKLLPVEADSAQVRIAGWALAASLSHPHLVRLLHSGQTQSEGCAVDYAVTEYADELLSEILPERPLTPAEVREMLDPILDALAYRSEEHT